MPRTGTAHPRMVFTMLIWLCGASACSQPSPSTGHADSPDVAAPVALPDASTDATAVADITASWNGLCHPCASNDECAGLFDATSGGACVAIGRGSGVDGRICALPCASGPSCPAGLKCTERGDQGSFCLPSGDACTCSFEDIAAGVGTACVKFSYDGTDRLVGQCTGQRTCGDGGLSACSLAGAPTEVCDGADNDCNGLVDDLGSGCDDANACTTDSCDPNKGCKHATLAGTCELDGKPCTADHCSNGACVGGSALDCPQDPTPVWLPGPCALPPGPSCAAAPSGGGCGVTFTRTFGAKAEEEARGLLARPDGGLVFIGGTDAWSKEGKRDAFLVLTDGCGNPGVVRGYGGDDDDELGAIAEVADGGFLLGGTTRSWGPWFDGWVVRTDATGSVQWSIRIGGPGYDEVKGVRQVEDGGFVVAGDTYSAGPELGKQSAVFAAHLSADGKVLWTRAFGGAAGESLADVVEARDSACNAGGTLLVGTTLTWGAGLHDAWAVRLDADGNLAWSKAYGSPAEDFALAATRTPDGGFALAGRTQGLSANAWDALILRLDPAGEVVWTQRLGGSDDDLASAVRAVPGGLWIAGHGVGLGTGSQDAFVARLAGDGTVVGARAYGTLAPERDVALAATPDGGFALAGRTIPPGNTHFNTWLVKLDSLGDGPTAAAKAMKGGWASASVQPTVTGIALKPEPSGAIAAAAVSTPGFAPKLPGNWAKVQGNCGKLGK